MVSRFPVHEIRLGSVRACIWEESRQSVNGVQESEFSVSIVRHMPGARVSSSYVAEAVRFGVEDLPLIAQVMDLAHLWIHEQAVGV